jgi:hypothetical protein
MGRKAGRTEEAEIAPQIELLAKIGQRHHALTDHLLGDFYPAGFSLRRKLPASVAYLYILPSFRPQGVLEGLRRRDAAAPAIRVEPAPNHQERTCSVIPKLSTLL